MRIAFYFEDKGYSNKDFSQPSKGNPGIGGTQYMILLLVDYLIKKHSDIDIYIIHHNNSNRLPDKCNSIIVMDEEVVFEECNNNSISVLVHNTGKGANWYWNANELNVNLVVWAHCYLGYQEMQLCAQYNNVKKVVFVGRQEYDRYVDCDINKKCTYIYNMFDFSEISYIHNCSGNIVTYMGSITREKGFHILAKQWKKVLKKVPDAELIVIGTGSLYSASDRMGKYGIAEAEYENDFMKYLVDENEEILPSVNFVGIVGSEKKDIFAKTKVGVVNPSAVSETFCISAIEMQSVGVPVVTKNSFGLCDTNKNMISGLTYNREKMLAKCITKLLLDDGLNDKLSKTARQFAIERFDVNVLGEKWYDLLLNLEREENYIKPSNCFFNDLKVLRVLNRYVRKIIGFERTMAVEDIKENIKKLMRR